MAYDVTYDFSTLAGNQSDFTWDGPDVDVLSAENTDGAWCWTSTGSTSSTTGPPSGTACVYTETSSPVEVGDEFIMTLASANEVDASAYSLFVTFDNCMQGSTTGQLYFEAWDGSAWQSIDDWLGDSTTAMTSRGPYDFTSYTNSDFSVRFRVIVAGTTYYNDFSVTDIRIYGDDKITGPSITDIEDEQLDNYETGIIVDGSSFGASQGSGKLEITPTSTYANAVEQTTTSWSDTQIVFTLDRGSIAVGTAYVWVTDDNSDRTESYAVTINALIPTVTSVGDENVQPSETGIVVDGSNFFASQGVGKVEFCPSSTYGSAVTQTVTNWGASSVTVTAVQGTLAEGTIYAFVTNSDGGRNSTGFALTLSVPVNPIITDIEDENLVVGETGIVLDGSSFGASKGSGKLEICATDTYSTAVEQTTTSWNDNEIIFTTVQGSLSVGTNYVFVTTDGGLRNITGYMITLTPGATSTGLYQTTNLQLTITSAGLNTTVFLISDE